MDGRREQQRGALFGLTAALLFGASAPLAKRLLPGVTPLMLAALLYGGAGMALLAWGLLRRARSAESAGPSAAAAGGAEASLRAADVPALAGIVLLGGVVGPIGMLYGLSRLSGVSGALLLNLEAPLTALLAVLVFREHLGWKGGLAIALVVGAAALLGLGDAGGGEGVGHASLAGVACIAGACLAWAIDNNLTQRLSVRDPIAVVRIKALGAAACNLALAVASGSPAPAPALGVAALAVGAASYGVSVVLDFHALRILGAAREAAYFATAPFAGALVAVPLLGQRPGAVELLAAVLMIGGVVALFRDRHAHRHTHEPIAHDHLHVHDEHHQHSHEGVAAGVMAPGSAHAHWHIHEPITHEHPHSSDVHHRHRH